MANRSAPIEARTSPPPMGGGTRRAASAVLLALVALFSVSPAHAADAEPPLSAALESPAPLPHLLATVAVSGFGEFTIEMNREEAPNHVAHFLVLAQEGYFDSLAFHRVVPGFVIQTGDPASRDEDPWNDGMGGPPYRLPHEAATTTHLRGTVSMSWRGDIEGTAGSQWFVALDYAPQLDGHATPIGRVISGMDTVDRISQVTTLVNDSPLHPVRITHIQLHEAPLATDSASEDGTSEE